MISEPEVLDVREPPGKAMGKVAELWKPVEEVHSGDVLSSLADLNGRTAPAVVTASGTRRAASFRISVAGMRESLIATAEHPILTMRGWVTLTNLRLDDWVLVARDRSSESLSSKLLDVPAHGAEAHPAEMARFWRLVAKRNESTPRFAWSPIVRIAQESSREPVYSFECVPLHNYVANDVVVHNCRYCFLPNTLIMTDTGYEPIESMFAAGAPTENPEIRLLGWKNILTHRNRWRVVTKAFEHFYAGQVLEIRVRGLPPLRCTLDHPLFGPGPRGELRKVRADRLRIGDLVAVPRIAAGAPKPIIEADMEASDDTRVLTLLAAERLEISQAMEEYLLVPVVDIREKTYIGPVYNLEVAEDQRYP